MVEKAATVVTDAVVTEAEARVPDASVASGGLRERKKSDTREALREAAHRLFAEQGFTGTTIDQIAEAADVSRRTFFRYFSSKDELLAEGSDLLPLMLTALRSRPADEPPLPAILGAWRALIGPEGPPVVAANLAQPGGGARAKLGMIRVLAQWESGIADTLLARRGLDPRTAPEADRLRAHVTACAATSALRSSAEVYRERRAGTGLETRHWFPIVEQAFAVLAEGCVDQGVADQAR